MTSGWLATGHPHRAAHGPRHGRHRDRDTAARPAPGHGALAAPPPGREHRGGRRGVRRHGGADRVRPHLLFVCGTPGDTHAELIDAQWDERPHLPVERRRHRGADAPHPRRGGDAHGRAPGARLDARQPEVVERTLEKLRNATRAADRWWRADRARPRRREPALGDASAQAGSGSPTARPPDLLRGDPGRDDRAGRRHHADRQPRRAVVPRGLVPSRPGVRFFRLDRIEAAASSTGRHATCRRRRPASSTTCSCPARAT